MSASTENRSQVDLGERLLVTGLMLVLVSESLLATAAMVRLAYLHVLLGIASVGVALFLANWVYSGNKTARNALLGWAGLQVVVTGLAVMAYLSSGGNDSAMRVFGIAAPTNGTAIGLALLKLAAYLFVGGLLLQTSSVRHFLAYKAGEEVHEIEQPSIAPSGVVIALNDKEKQALADLGAWMWPAGLVLIAVGILLLTVAARDPGHNAIRYGIEGVLVLLLGAVMLGPAAVIRKLAPDNLDLAFLVNAVGQLKALFSRQLFIYAGLVVAVVVVLVLRIL